MLFRTLATVFCAGSLVAAPAFAQENGIDMEETQEAADAMITSVYVYEPVTAKSVEEVVNKLADLGYTEIEDFDVEWDEYEVEAVTPGGEEVEIDIDPITGRILEIEEDFL